jgi:hypothetical protein
VVAWLSGTTLSVQRIDAKGVAIGTPIAVGTASASFAVAATASGGWVLAWIDAGTVNFRRYDANGTALGAAAAVDAVTYAQLGSVQVETGSDGSFVVGWSGRQAGDTSSRVLLRKFSAAGVAQGPTAAISSTAGEASGLQLSVLPDGKLLAAWVQGNADNSAYSVVARVLGADLTASGMEHAVQAALPTIDRPADLALATLANGSSVLAWAQGSLDQVRWQLLDANAAPTLATAQVLSLLTPVVESIQAVPAASGFTLLVEHTVFGPRGTNGTVSALSVDASGALTSRTDLQGRTLQSISPTTGAVCGPAPSGIAAAGGADGRYVLVQESCVSQGVAQLEVVGR